MNLSRNLKIKITLIIIGAVLIGAGIFVAGTRFGSNSGEPKTITTPQANTATESAKVDGGDEKKSDEEVKGSTSQVVSQPPTKTTTEQKTQSDRTTRKYLGLKFEALLRALEETTKFLEKSNISIGHFPARPYLDNAEVERNKSVSYNSQIHPNGALETSAYNNCRAADEDMRVYIISLRAWGYYHLIGDLENSSKAMKLIGIQGDIFDKSFDACATDIDRLGIETN